MSDSKIRGYRVSEEIFSTLRMLDTTLRRLEEFDKNLAHVSGFRIPSQKDLRDGVY